MTVAHVYTVAFQGIEAREVDVQVHIGDGGNGLFNIVGLADKAVCESRERVRAALSAIGLALLEAIKAALAARTANVTKSAGSSS
jgi:magnesium chelatase family protein